MVHGQALAGWQEAAQQPIRIKRRIYTIREGTEILNPEPFGGQCRPVAISISRGRPDSAIFSSFLHYRSLTGILILAFVLIELILCTGLSFLRVTEGINRSEELCIAGFRMLRVRVHCRHVARSADSALA